MVQVALEFTGESYREMSRLERETPRTFRSAHAAAARRAQNRLRKVMAKGGGVYGVPTFAPLAPMTRQLRAVGFSISRRPYYADGGAEIGGMLADKSMIFMFKRGDGQVVGWSDKMANWASGFQGHESYAWTPRQLEKFGRLHVKAPSYYDRPARPVIDPFTAQLQRDFPGLVREAYDKAVARRMKKGQVIA